MPIPKQDNLRMLGIGMPEKKTLGEILNFRLNHLSDNDFKTYSRKFTVATCVSF